MERRLALGQSGGALNIREEGARAVFDAALPEDGRGLYKLYLSGAGGSQLLGTLIPENGRLRLKRTISIAELTQKGCWPPTGAEAKLSFAFGAQTNTPLASGAPGWSREYNPAQLMGDRVLAHAAAELHGALLRRTEGGFVLAVPFEKTEPFPMTPILCFAYIEQLHGKEYAIFHFNSCGCPIFQNKEKRAGNTDGANQ